MRRTQAVTTGAEPTRHGVFGIRGLAARYATIRQVSSAERRRRKIETSNLLESSRPPSCSATPATCCGLTASSKIRPRRQPGDCRPTIVPRARPAEGVERTANRIGSHELPPLDQLGRQESAGERLGHLACADKSDRLRNHGPLVGTLGAIGLGVAVSRETGLPPHATPRRAGSQWAGEATWTGVLGFRDTPAPHRSTAHFGFDGQSAA